MDQEQYLREIAAANQVVALAPDPRLTFDAPLIESKPVQTGWLTSIPVVAVVVPEPTVDECEEGFSVKQSHAVRCVLDGMSQQKTSEVVGVTRRTICEWVKLPAFKKVVRRYRKDGFAASVGILQSNSLELATTLITLAKNPLVDPADRIRASVSALRFAQEQVFNEEIAERLDQIELSRSAGPTNGSTFSVVKRADES
jgi:hypothetical protein